MQSCSNVGYLWPVRQYRQSRLYSTNHSGTPRQIYTSRQSLTMAANFTLSLLGPCLGTATKYTQRDRWCRPGKRTFYCPLRVYVFASVCLYAFDGLCVYACACLRASSCVFIRFQTSLCTPQTSRVEAPGYASSASLHCFLLPSEVSGNVTGNLCLHRSF